MMVRYNLIRVSAILGFGFSAAIVEVVTAQSTATRCLASMGTYVRTIRETWKTDDTAPYEITRISANQNECSGDNLIKSWSVELLKGGDATDREILATVNHPGDSAYYYPDLLNQYYKNIRITFPDVLHNSFQSGEAYGVFVTVSDATFSEQRLVAKVYPNLIAPGSPNLQDCAASLVALTESHYTFEATDQTRFAVKFSYDPQYCDYAKYLDQRLSISVQTGNNGPLAGTASRPVMASDGSNTFTATFDGWSASIKCGDFHSYSNDLDINTIYRIGVVASSDETAALAYYTGPSFTVTTNGASFANCLASVNGGTIPQTNPSFAVGDPVDYVVSYTYDPLLCKNREIYSACTGFKHDVGKEGYRAMPAFHGRAGQTGNGKGICEFPGLSSNQLEQGQAYDFTVRMVRTIYPTQATVNVQLETMTPILGTPTPSQCKNTLQAANSKENPTGGQDLGFTYNAGACAISYFATPDANGVYAYLYLLLNDQRQLVAKATHAPRFAYGRIDYWFIYEAGVTKRSLITRAVNEYVISVPNNGDPIEKTFSELAGSDPIMPAQPEISPGSERRRAVAEGRALPSNIDCAPAQKACPVSGRVGVWECVNVLSDINSCGGCPGEASSVDCALFDNIESVGCEVGICKVYTCEEGYALASNATVCILS